MFLRLCLLFALFVAGTDDAHAQMRSQGELFLQEVRKDERGKISEKINDPGFRLINFRGSNGETALIIMAEDKREAWVRALLRRNADPNVRRDDGESAMTLAARLQSVQMVEDLLAYGAEPDIANRLGETPLMIAVRMRNEQMVRRLVEAGADPDRSDHATGMSARDLARRDTRTPELLALLDGTPEEEPENKLKFGPILR
ncbi:ankyrin repeat domain-containing protein [Sphingomicrobium sp. XHP0239]|uniref:ankyrin repeat domain-containing protein n=1 Tax=Sphingomicrobium maritimum TaxID=3133972 RepID=UPI0031CCBF14